MSLFLFVLFCALCLATCKAIYKSLKRLYVESTEKALNSRIKSVNVSNTWALLNGKLIKIVK